MDYEKHQLLFDQPDIDGEDYRELYLELMKCRKELLVFQNARTEALAYYGALN